MKGKTAVPKSIYPGDSEWRDVDRIAEREERSNSKIVEMAIRAFVRMYDRSPDQAMKLAKEYGGSSR